MRKPFRFASDLFINGESCHGFALRCAGVMTENYPSGQARSALAAC